MDTLSWEINLSELSRIPSEKRVYLGFFFPFIVDPFSDWSKYGGKQL